VFGIDERDQRLAATIAEHEDVASARPHRQAAVRDSIVKMKTAERLSRACIDDSHDVGARWLARHEHVEVHAAWIKAKIVAGGSLRLNGRARRKRGIRNVPSMVNAISRASARSAKPRDDLDPAGASARRSQKQEPAATSIMIAQRA